MSSIFTEFHPEVYENFCAAADGLVVEFENGHTLLSDPEDSMDDAFDDAYDLVDELYDEDEEPGLNSEAIHEVNILASIALCDAAKFKVIDGVGPYGENFND